jgi:polyphosphate glucokinase
MNVLMVDIGGTNGKVMASYDGEMRRMPSGQVLTASEMVRGVLALTADLEFDRVSLGLPCLVEHGKPALEPSNLGNGWVGFDYSQAFGKPVRCINDAAMHALGNYTSGRLLFLGFGTGIGATLIVGDVVVPIEIGLVKLNRMECLVDRLSKTALKRDGREHWMEAVLDAVELLQNVFKPDQTVLGGGNAKFIDPFLQTAVVWTTDPPISVRSACGKIPTSSPVPMQRHGESIARGHRRISSKTGAFRAVGQLYEELWIKEIKQAFMRFAERCGISGVEEVRSRAPNRGKKFRWNYFRRDLRSLQRGLTDCLLDTGNQRRCNA